MWWKNVRPTLNNLEVCTHSEMHDGKESLIYAPRGITHGSEATGSQWIKYSLETHEVCHTPFCPFVVNAVCNSVPKTFSILPWWENGIRHVCYQSHHLPASVSSQASRFNFFVYKILCNVTLAKFLRNSMRSSIHILLLQDTVPM